MKNKFKNQKGVISVFAMLAMLFFLLFILGAYMAVSRSNRTQKESNEEILKIYSTEVNAQDIYDEMISYSDDVRPLYTYNQVNDIGKEIFYAINEKVYDFKLAEYEFSELKTNLNVAGLNDSSTNNYNKVNAGEYQYVENSSLKLSLDGTNNTGTEHSDKAVTWANLSTVNGVSDKYNIYGGGINPLVQGEVNWVHNGLALDGAGDFVLCNNIIPSGNSSQTLEIVFKTLNNKNQNLIGSWGKNAGGGLSINGGSLRGDFFFEGNINSSITSKYKVETDKITYAAVTFDGNKIRLYKNGKKVSEDSDNTIKKAVTETIKYKTVDTVSAEVGDVKVKLGVKASIGNSGSNNPSNYVLYPYFVTNSDYTNGIFYTGGKYNFSTIYIKDLLYPEKEPISQSGTSYSQNIASFKGENLFKIEYQVLAGPNNDIIPITFSYENGLKIGSLDTESSFSVVATGSDSVVIRSNIGKVQTWYFNGVPKGPSITNGEVNILGTYYYCFEGLEPGTEYDIYAEFKPTETAKFRIKSVEGKYENSIFIGNNYNNKYDGIAGGGFEGTIFAVRVYDKALTSDQIGVNYKIDKSRFSIID